jgi:hypothetical protein
MADLFFWGKDGTCELEIPGMNNMTSVNKNINPIEILLFFIF